MFTSILNSTTASLSVQDALICTAVSLAIGFVIAGVYMMSGKCSKNFVITLALLPAVVQVVIMMVNGNLGAGVAVAGAFSLVRFRSVPGTSKEIAMIFFAMSAGLATGMGFITFALAFTAIIGVVFLALSKLGFGETKSGEKQLRITIPETLDYTGAFDDIFKTYLKKVQLERVKTTNLGSMFELTYDIEMKNEQQEKAMLDELRCRNGNLTIICGKLMKQTEQL